MKLPQIAKRFGADILGVICILLAFLLGPLPGPGGIPLLIAGLSLLSIHNPWAKNLLDYARKHSTSFRAILFPRKKHIELLWDCTAFVLIGVWITVLLIDISSFAKAISTVLLTSSIVILVCNRSRIDKILKKT